VKKASLPHLLNLTRYQIELNQPYIDMEILHTIEKAFQRCEEIFLLNDFMPPPVMTT